MNSRLVQPAPNCELRHALLSNAGMPLTSNLKCNHSQPCALMVRMLYIISCFNRAFNGGQRLHLVKIGVVRANFQGFAVSAKK